MTMHRKLPTNRWESIFGPCPYEHDNAYAAGLWCIIHFGRGLRLGIPNPIHKWSSSIREFEHETGAASTHDREVNS